MKIGDYDTHPAADILDLIEGKDFDKLVESIKTGGLQHPIVLEKKVILDGRNRLRACMAANVRPRFEQYTGKDPIRYVFAVNLERRHLNASQKAMAADELANLEQGHRLQTRTSAGLKSVPIAQAAAAKITGASERLTQQARFVRIQATPEVVATVKSGRMAVTAAAELALLPAPKQREIVKKLESKREIKSGNVRALVRQERRREVVQRINTGRVEPLPDGEFGLIYGDYPWKYENGDQHDGSRGHMTYPPMEMDEILAHAREAAKRAAKHCVIALWFTNAFLFEIGRVVAAYGATQHTAWTWDKTTINDKDKAGVGSWGRGRTEHLVIASIGNPVHTLNEVGTLIRAVVREHSRKPDVFAELLLKHASGPHLELFAREPRDGWTVWGAETNKFAAKAVA